jgi:predicted Rossmann fold flavoprotein
VPDANCDVVIVGAGAAGLATAIFARRHNPRRSVVLLDGAKKPGAKILVSGGSRCNVTNVVVTERDFWGGRSAIVRRILRSLPVSETVAFFREIGVALHEEANGKLFPDSNRARDVLDALLAEAASRGATLAPDHRVLDVVHDRDAIGHRFRVTTSRGELTANAVVLATGGKSLPKTGSDGAGLDIARQLGHAIVPTTPALAPLVIDDAASRRELSGVAQDVELSIWIDGAIAQRLRGALLWTHFGVSGPVALDASRHILRARVDERPVKVTVNLRPGDTFDAVDADLTMRAVAQPRSTLHGALAAMMPASVAAATLRRNNVDGATALAHLSRDDRRRVARAIVESALAVVDSRGYNFAEATAGGVAVTDIDPATMASRVCPELFMVGEMLDVDGRIGGFNFQWAWSSGFVAGRALANRTARG